MIRRTLGYLATPRLGVVLLLLGFGCASASTARAGCLAHYLTVGNASDDVTARLELLGLAGALPVDPELPAPGRPAPCTGAFCSGDPATPASPTTSVPPPGSGEWAALPEPVPLSGPGSNVFPPVHDGLLPIGDPAPIFHPPRSPFPPPIS